MMYAGISVMLSTLLLSLAFMATGAPTASESATTIGNLNTTTTEHSIITSRSPTGIEYMSFGSQYFQPCFLNLQQADMCTITYISHPSWGDVVHLFMYDNECTRIGDRFTTTRDMLAAKGGWGMTSQLPKFLVISVARDWEPIASKDAGVKLDYSDIHFKPFVDGGVLPFDSSYTVRGKVGDYTVFRAAFPRW